MAVLTTKQRKNLGRKTFALPPKRKGKNQTPEGEKGRYPIPDRTHAQNALARVSQHGTPAEKKAVRAKVHAKYPDMGKYRKREK
jgi:hypothetical protein